jgi:prepilin signal peptidase PulO-like enzyme (type II secretory pathway)
MGMGDVKAAAGLGTMLAWRGWTALIVGGFAGFLFAAVHGIALLVYGRATRKHHIPLGPFMIAGAFLVILVGVEPAARGGFAPSGATVRLPVLGSCDRVNEPSAE